MAGSGRARHPCRTEPRNRPAAGRPAAGDHRRHGPRIEAAARGFDQWRKTAPQERAAVLHRTAALVRERAEELARLATLEEGKPIVEARGEVAATAALLDFHAGEAVRTYGRVLPRPTGTRSLVLHQPVGPVAAFCA